MNPEPGLRDTVVLIYGAGRAPGPALALALAQQGAPAPAVTVVKVEEREITPAVSFTGRIEAKDKVDLRARVEGRFPGKIVIFPVFILFIGIDVQSKLAVGAIAAFFPISLLTIAGMREVKKV